jgi:alpha-tubulin suppressor-like RCC1 family protein
LGDLVTRSTPELALTDVADAFCFGSAAFVRNLVIRTDGTLWAAGSNVNSALGVDATTAHYSTFTQCLKTEDGGTTTSPITNVVDVECNGHSVVVRDASGQCWGVGAGASGSLGVGLLDATVAFYRPVPLHRRVVVDHSMGGTAGSSISMFLLDDGQLYISGIGTANFNTDPLATTWAVPGPVVL